MKKTLILGATTNTTRYSYLVANKLVRKGHPIVNVGRKVGEVAGVVIEPAETIHTDIDTITMYVGPRNQAPYYDYILQTNPKRVIFNPGSENPDLQQKLKDAGIEIIEGCTLVMLNTGQF
ncbi:CoA-binding protein [Sphingobacterium alkalisoli]|uniref:CoA-binding protein n=1 Tax=Sphingobacterium alkalisoli TaxID=1874115 RepID=A0A4U0HCD8_9SPHI|nr:CoA-binding protein [Sphingobacterium alkalisoli]TJY68292.1 CoA-binding protein [Sphingobacterium alkalisoli]GGH07533.1 CoA-binding protein [Sphingobacterium alkalisoli]